MGVLHLSDSPLTVTHVHVRPLGLGTPANILYPGGITKNPPLAWRVHVPWTSSKNMMVVAFGVVSVSASQFKTLSSERGRTRIRRGQVRHPNEFVTQKPNLQQCTSLDPLAYTQVDKVQFSNAIFYAEEGQSQVTVDVFRLGSLEGSCFVKYRTIPGTAKPGHKYIEKEGYVKFDPLVSSQSFTVDIIPDDLWNQVLEFRIELSLEHDSNCEVELDMSRCRIKVIDADIFPSNKFSKEVAEDKVADIPGTDLLIEYFKFNLQLPGMFWRSIYVLVIDQLPNLYFLLTTYLVKYVADNLVSSKDSHTVTLSEAPLLVVVALYVLPYAILQILAYTKIDTGLAQTARAYLQASAFSRFMNLSDMARTKANVTDVKLTIAQDVTDLVNLGFMKIFEIGASVGRLACICYFLLSENPTAILPIVVYALFVPCAFMVNYPRSVDLSERIGNKQADIVDAVQEGHAKYRVIADYRMRPLIEGEFEDRLLGLNSVMPRFEKNAIDQTFLSGWVVTLLIGVYLLFGANQVMVGSLQLGTFLATINVFKEVGESFKETYTAVLEMSRSISPLQKLTRLMNTETELTFLSHVMRRRRLLTRELRANGMRLSRKRTTRLFCGTDAIPIQLMNLSFKHPNGKSIMNKVNLMIRQGAMVAVVGYPRGGKSTLMKLLGYIKQPSNGLVYIPSHLRVLHVPPEPILLTGSLWKNLALDREPGNSFVDDRVIRICERLGFSKDLVAQLKAEIKYAIEHTDIQAIDPSIVVRPSWQQEICTTDQVLINIARAMVFNPEVLVMQKPTALLSEPLARNIFACLRQHQLNRGLELPAETLYRRRPRTLFISTVRMVGVNTVDTVWMVGDGAVQEVPKSLVTQELLN